MPPVPTQVEKRNFWKWHTAKRYLAILNLEASNYWKSITVGGNLQKNTTKPSFFWLLKAWSSNYHLHSTRNSKPCSQIEWNCFRNQSVKKCKKRSNAKILTEEKQNFHMMGVNKASPLLSKDFKVYWWSHLLKNLNIPVPPQKEKELL